MRNFKMFIFLTKFRTQMQNILGINLKFRGKLPSCNIKFIKLKLKNFIWGNFLKKNFKLKMSKYEVYQLQTPLASFYILRKHATLFFKNVNCSQVLLVLWFKHDLDTFGNIIFFYTKKFTPLHSTIATNFWKQFCIFPKLTSYKFVHAFAAETLCTVA